MKLNKLYKITLCLSMIVSLLTTVTNTNAVTNSGSFTVASMNVDGMPNKVSVNSIYNYDLNKDGPGSDGSKAISKKLGTYGWDLIALSEDFNFHSEIMSSLTGYGAGSARGSIPTNWNIFSLPKWPLDTDGLNILYKKASTTISNEKFISWNTKYGTDINVVIAKIPAGNGADNMIDKGYRFYQANMNGIIVDVYSMHMDADSAEGDIAARNDEWQQLVNAIKQSNNGNPIIVMGDTNSRYTREKVKEIFIDGINADPRFTVKDAWIEHAHNGNYPTYGSESIVAKDHGGTYDYPQAEIVDKIFYINNTDSDYEITSKSYTVNTDFIDASGSPLADHWPISVEFEYTTKVTEHTHDYQLVASKASTCKEEGFKTYQCGCGHEYTETLPKLDHTIVTEPGVAATCTTAGKTDYKYCTVCGEVLEASTTIPAFNHHYVNGVCTICNEKDPNYVKDKDNYTISSTTNTITSGKQYVIVSKPTTSEFALTTTASGAISYQPLKGKEVGANYVWTIENVSGGIVIKTTVNGETKYLARTKTLTTGGYKVTLQDTPYTWATKVSGGKLYINDKVGNATYALRYYSTAYQFVVSSKVSAIYLYEAK